MMSLFSKVLFTSFTLFLLGTLGVLFYAMANY